MYKPNAEDEFSKLYFLLTKMEEYGNTEGLDYLYIKSRCYILARELGVILLVTCVAKPTPSYVPNFGEII